MGSNQQVDTADAPSGAPSVVRYQVLAAACSVAVIAYIHRVGFASASPDIQKDLGFSERDIGGLMTAFVLAYALFEMPWGILGDKLGVRHVLTLLVFGWSLVTGAVTLVLLLPAVWSVQLISLLVLRFVFGMFQAGGFPLLSRMMADWMPSQERGLAQGVIWMSSRLGGAAVPMLLGLLAVLGPWPIRLWVLTAIGIVWCLVFWPWFRNRPEDMPRVNAAEHSLIVGGRTRSAGHVHLPWSTLLRSRNVWGLCLMYGFGGFSASFFITMLPVYLRNHRHLNDQQTRLLTSLPLACGIIACVVGGYVSDRIIRTTGNRKWGRRLNGAIGLTVAGFAMLATIWVHEVWALAVLLCLAFFCNDLNMGPAWASCADIGERYAGTIGGAMNMIGNLFAALMTMTTGALLNRGDLPISIAGVDILGRTLLFVILAASFMMGTVCWFLVDVTQPLMDKEAG